MADPLLASSGYSNDFGDEEPLCTARELGEVSDVSDRAVYGGTTLNHFTHHRTTHQAAMRTTVGKVAVAPAYPRQLCRPHQIAPALFELSAKTTLLDAG